MAIAKEQIEAITKPFPKINLDTFADTEAAIKAGFEKIAQSAGQSKPAYIVSNAETMEQYKQLLADKDQAKMQAQIEYAQKNWPHFKELEPLITDILKQWPHATLEKAYQKALQTVEEKNHKLYWTPVIESEWSKPNELPDIAKLTFKQKQFFDSNQNLTLKFKPGYWSGKVPTPQPIAPQPVPMWKMGQTIPLLKKLQPESRKYGYHVCLGGGVLNNWNSDKDLDLYYLPMNNECKAKPKELIHYLAGLWGKPEPIGKSADYPHDALPYIAKLKFEFTDEDGVKRRIDLFVMGAEAFDVHDCLDSMSAVLPTSFMAKIIHRKRSPKS